MWKITLHFEGDRLLVGHRRDEFIEVYLVVQQGDVPRSSGTFTGSDIPAKLCFEMDTDMGPTVVKESEIAWLSWFNADNINASVPKERKDIRNARLRTSYDYLKNTNELHDERLAARLANPAHGPFRTAILEAAREIKTAQLAARNLENFQAAQRRFGRAAFPSPPPQDPPLPPIRRRISSPSDSPRTTQNVEPNSVHSRLAEPSVNDTRTHSPPPRRQPSPEQAASTQRGRTEEDDGEAPGRLFVRTPSLMERSLTNRAGNAADTSSSELLRTSLTSRPYSLFSTP